MNSDPRSWAVEGASDPAMDASGTEHAGNSPQDAAICEAFDIADGLFREAAADFTHLRKRLRDAGLATTMAGASANTSRKTGGKTKTGDDIRDGLKEAVRLARELRSATQLMLEERNRIDRFRKEIAGGVGGGGALDLDAARDEIGRRLACLRRAGGG